MKRPSKAVRALARRAANVAADASLDGLDAAQAVMAAALYVCFSSADMTRLDVADWLRRLAAEIEAEAAEYGAQVRAALRK